MREYESLKGASKYDKTLFKTSYTAISSLQPVVLSQFKKNIFSRGKGCYVPLMK